MRRGRREVSFARAPCQITFCDQRYKLALELQ